MSQETGAFLDQQPLSQDFHSDLLWIVSALVNDGLDSGTVLIFQKEYPKLYEVGTNLLGAIDASFSSPEPA